MYKVFLNDKVIILTDSYDMEAMSKSMLYFQYDDFEEINFIISLLEDSSGLLGAVLQSTNLDELWADFRSHFREIEAAGGLVENARGDLLLIHRFGRWDLPKGKREANEAIEECALREVQEECGIDQLVLGPSLPDSFHTYSLNGYRYLKRTYWFEMNGNQDDLVPQAAEGILQARWFSQKEIDWTVMPTYPNIRLLIDAKTGHH